MRRPASLSVACLAAGVVAGCALAPAQVREANRRTEMTSASAPATAIHCVARKSQEGRSGMIASSIRPMTGHEHYETAIWRMDNAVAVVEAAPAAKGSTLTVYLSPHTLDSAAADLMEKAKGC